MSYFKRHVLWQELPAQKGHWTLTWAFIAAAMQVPPLCSGVFYPLPKLSLQWPCRCHCCTQGWIPCPKGHWTRTWAFIAAAMQVPPLRSGVFYSLPKLSLQWPCRCHCCAKGWIPRQPTRPPLGVTRASLLLHSRLKAPKRSFVCAPSSSYDELDSTWGLLRLGTSRKGFANLFLDRCSKFKIIPRKKVVGIPILENKLWD